MNPADPKITQPTSTTPAADATTSSVQQAAQKQIDALAQVAPQDQRARTTNIKDTSSQPAEVSSLANDSAAIANAQPAARAPEVAAIRLTPEVTPASESSRTVSITVQLASGQTAQASVSERAGTVDVKIVTPTAASAQRVSSEMDGMRQNLDAAGIKLGQAEISYQRGEGGGHGREEYQPPAQQQSANGKEVFIMNEVLQ
jgi:flagellar hook-length control protein FliK